MSVASVRAAAAVALAALAGSCDRADRRVDPDRQMVEPPGDAGTGREGGDDDRRVGPLPSLAPLVARIRPSVVNIVAERQVRTSTRDRLGRHVYVPRSVANSLGSGFIIDRDGHILTNQHVVEGANVFSVQLDDGREVPARFVGADEAVDLAVLDIDVEQLEPLALGDSDRIRVGDYVVAIGNPLGLSNSVTAGIVSALGREVTGERPGYADFIQTDASINQGNSGGPLVDLEGRVIGINTAVADAQGIGFAVPINMVKLVLPQILQHGSVTRSWIGLWWRVLDLDAGREAGLPAPAAGQTGWVLVVDVVPGGPAHAAGVRPNDVVLAFAGDAVTRPTLFPWAVSTAPIGRPVEVRIWRQGRDQRLEAVPVEVPE
jgi:serine protease Do